MAPRRVATDGGPTSGLAPRRVAWLLLVPIEPRRVAWLLSAEDTLEKLVEVEPRLTASLPDIRSETDFIPPSFVSGSLARTESPSALVWSTGARKLRTSCRCPSGSICHRSSWTRDSGATGRGARKPIRSCWKRDAVRSTRSEESNDVLWGCTVEHGSGLGGFPKRGGRPNW